MTWRAHSPDGKIEVVADDGEIDDSSIARAVIWALKVRQRAGLTAIVLENDRTHYSRLITHEHYWPPGTPNV